MTSTSWTLTPAGDLGLGDLEARRYACAAARRAVPAVLMGAQGTGVPTSGPAARVRDVAFRGVAVAPFGTATEQVQNLQHDAIGTNGTTLGIHSPGRPLS